MDAPGATCKVLVVDDNPSLRDVLTVLLRQAGYGVETAEHGREALDRLRAAPDRPCLILLDLTMPVMSGPQFRAAQAGDPALADIPVLVISAQHDGSEVAAALGAVGYLEKPVDLDELLRHIRRHCPAS